MRLAWVRARCFVHATEDEERVRGALLYVLGLSGDAKARDRVERKRAKGHYGNPIVLLEAAVKNRRDMEAAAGRLFDDAERRAAVRESLGARLDDDNVVHVRLDKQSAVQGRTDLGEGSDAIVVRLKGLVAKDEIPLRAWAQWLDARPSGPPPEPARP